MDSRPALIRPYQDSDHDAVAALWSDVSPKDPPWKLGRYRTR